MAEERFPSSEEMIRRAREELAVPPLPSTEREEIDFEAMIERAARPSGTDAVIDLERELKRERKREDASRTASTASPEAPPARPLPPPPSTPRRRSPPRRRPDPPSRVPRRPGPVGTPPTVPGEARSGGGRFRWGFLVFFVIILINIFSNFFDTDSTPTTSAPPVTGAPEAIGGQFITEEFDGGLEPGWIWSNEDRESWSLSERRGALLIEDAGFSDGVVRNLLLRDAPPGGFEITTFVEFQPTSSFQAAGIIVYGDDDDYVLLTRAFCGFCVGDDGVYLDSINEGVRDSDGGHRLEETADGVYLRLRVAGDTMAASYSVDGTTWRGAGQTIKLMTSPQIGILVWPNDPAPPPAYFHFFEVSPV